MEHEITKTREELPSLVKSLSDELAKVRGQRDELRYEFRRIADNIKNVDIRNPDYPDWVSLERDILEVIGRFK